MSIRVINADVLDGLAQLPDESVHCVVTSPPYWGLRDYGVDGQIGLESTPAEFVSRLVCVFREVRRVLRKDGTCWVNLGDSYANNASTSKMERANQGNGSGSFQIPPEKHHQVRRAEPNRLTAMKRDGLKHKDLVGIPWRFALAMQDDGWWLRQDIIWHKPNPMPESVTDRCTKSHEYIFLLTKSERYYYDADAIREISITGDTRPPHGPGQSSIGGRPASGNRPVVSDTRKDLRSDIESRHRSSINGGQSLQAEPDVTRNKRSVWTIATAPFSEAHFATFPPELPELCIKAGCPKGGTVLDIFGGAGTTGLVADRLQRNAILIELNPQYAAMAERRVSRDRGGLLDLMESA